jgi:hypothetical protein
MTDLSGYAKKSHCPAGVDAPRMRWRLPTSAGAYSNPAPDLGLGRQRARVEPEVGMRFRTLGS